MAEFLNKKFPSEKEGIPNRSELVDEYFGQMFKSYAEVCISYTLASAASRGQDKITPQDLLISIDRLFPINTKGYEPEHISLMTQYSMARHNHRRKLAANRNLSKDRRIIKLKTSLNTSSTNTDAGATDNCGTRTSINNNLSNIGKNFSQKSWKKKIGHKDRLGNKIHAKTYHMQDYNCIVKPSKHIPLNQAFELL